jgi:hypothetical protein
MVSIYFKERVYKKRKVKNNDLFFKKLPQPAGRIFNYKLLFFDPGYSQRKFFMFDLIVVYRKSCLASKIWFVFTSIC